MLHNKNCDSVLCIFCTVKDFLFNLNNPNTYQFTLNSPFFFVLLLHNSFLVETLTGSKSEKFYSVVKTTAANGMTVIQKELANISGHLLVHRMDLSGIIIPYCKDPCSKHDQALIQKFCDFIWEYVGPRYSDSTFAKERKSTSRAFRWLLDAKVHDVQEKLNQLDNYFIQFNGLQ